MPVLSVMTVHFNARPYYAAGGLAKSFISGDHDTDNRKVDRHENKRSSRFLESGRSSDRHAGVRDQRLATPDFKRMGICRVAVTLRPNEATSPMQRPRR